VSGRPAELEALRDDWSRLSEESGNIFLTWELADAWWRHLGAGREPVFGSVRRDGRTVAVLPLHRGGRPLRTLRFVGAGVADQVGAICAPGDLPAAAGELRRMLGEVPHDLFLADPVDGAEGWSALLGAEPTVHEASPGIEIETSDWDEFLAGRTANFRQQAGKYERWLVRDHALSYRFTSDGAQLERDLDLVFELHTRRWGAGTTEFQQEPMRSLHREFARAAFERGWLRIWIAELNGRPAAAWYGFRFGDADWAYQSGRDTSLGWRADCARRARIGARTACGLTRSCSARRSTSPASHGGPRSGQLRHPAHPARPARPPRRPRGAQGAGGFDPPLGWESCSTTAERPSGRP